MTGAAVTDRVGSELIADSETIGADGNTEGWPLPSAKLGAPDEGIASSELKRAWMAPSIALLLIATWTGFFVWANLAIMSAPAPASAWTQWITAWAVPVLLVLVTLLVITRSSRREAARFGDAAQVLNYESARLEGRLTAVNTELSLARDFIAAQARDLETLGRIAAERLSTNAAQLQDLIQTNGAQVDRIAEVSDHALINMEKLRAQLPVITNSAKDVTNTIGNVGRAAHIQLEDLVAGFQRLNEFGVASERQVMQIHERVDHALAAFGEASDKIGAIANERFSALDQATEAHRGRLDQEEIAALAAIRARSHELATELEQQRSALAATETESAAALTSRFAALRSESSAFGQSIAQLEDIALTAFAERGGTQVAALRGMIEDISLRHDALIAESHDHTAKLADEADALDHKLLKRRDLMAQTAAEQSEQLARQLNDMDSAIAQRRAAISAAATDAADALAGKLAELDGAIEEQRQRQLESAQALSSQCEAIGERVSAFSSTLRFSSDQGGESAAVLDAAMHSLSKRIIDMRTALGGTDAHIEELTDSAVRLLELVQASADHTSTQLPEALRSTQAGLSKIEDRVQALRDALREAGDKGRALSGHVDTARNDIGGAMTEMSGLQQAFANLADEQQEQLAQLRETLASARAESSALSQEIDGSLSTAVNQLTEAASKAKDEFSEATLHQIEVLAESLGERSNAAITRVMQGRGAELIARLENAIDSTAASSRDTASQMRDQLAKVDELAANLESRVARARERANEQIDNDFARRSALITDSLNSTAIDITKAISADISETAWASYLRGDRGIFTRRAVSLLDNSEVRAVQQHYENDREFHQHVNRYIHDFESMLRQLLSARDGNVLGVTLLSSDMGKLYVALAQGIERLRT